MNVRLKKTYQWYSGVVWKDQFLINSYTASMDLVTKTMDPECQDLAYQRMNYWIYDVMQDAVIIDQANTVLGAYQATGQRLIVLPDEPVDQLIGMMLYCKLNAVMESHMLITDVSISSRAGDEMAYLHCDDESLGPFAEPGWWTDAGPKWSDIKGRRGKNNVIAMNRVPEWKDLGLEWTDPDPDKPSDVLFASFRKDEQE